MLHEIIMGSCWKVFDGKKIRYMWWDYWGDLSVWSVSWKLIIKWEAMHRMLNPWCDLTVLYFYYGAERHASQVRCIPLLIITLAGPALNTAQ